MFKLVERYYRLGLYSKGDLAAYVIRGTITAAQYKMITGEEEAQARTAEQLPGQGGRHG